MEEDEDEYVGEARVRWEHRWHTRPTGWIARLTGVGACAGASLGAWSIAAISPHTASGSTALGCATARERQRRTTAGGRGADWFKLGHAGVAALASAGGLAIGLMARGDTLVAGGGGGRRDQPSAADNPATWTAATIARRRVLCPQARHSSWLVHFGVEDIAGGSSHLTLWLRLCHTSKTLGNPGLRCCALS